MASRVINCNSLMVRLDLTITILLTDECFLRTDHNVLYLYYCSEYDLDDT